jgi:hypothetical protein
VLQSTCQHVLPADTGGEDSNAAIPVPITELNNTTATHLLFLLIIILLVAKQFE